MAYTQKQRDAAIAAVLDGLSKGIPLTVICRGEGMPSDWTIRQWADVDEELSTAIARARDTGFDVIAMDALKIIDEQPEQIATEHGLKRDPAAVNWQKARFEARLKLLAKWDPKRYGDKIDHTSSDGTMTPQAPVYNITNT